MTEYIWTPSGDLVEQANVTRLLRRHGARDIDELRRWSTEDIAWWWDAAVSDLELPFRTPYTDVVDLSRGTPWAQWFIGGRLNLVDACVGRWGADPATSGRPALVHETEAGTVETMSYGELLEAVTRAAAGLRDLGIREGDAVALFLPMIPEAVVAGYAVAAVGALLVPLFSGFAPKAIAARLADADVKLVVTADRTTRAGRELSLEPVLDEALELVTGVEHVVVVRRGDDEVPDAAGRHSWAELVASTGDGWVADVDASHPVLLVYTSGTTGKPKGAVHTHAGFLTKTASELAYSFDVRPDDTFCWVTDMGWIMGPLAMIGTHANGATLLLYEGVPTVPDVTRLWDLVDRHRVSVLGVSPTLIRTIRANGGQGHRSRDLTSVRILGSSGEPWDPDSYTWLGRDVFGGVPPIINFSGGTEVGGSFLAPYPVESLRPGSLGGPSLGMDVDVVDAAGAPVRGQLGELICRQAWPSMTQGLWRDPERYIETYWSMFDGVWRHGDWARIEEDGQWFIHGRSDEVMNVAGKRVGPAEIEGILTSHPAVAEAAAVGVPDETKGEAIWCYWVAADGDHGDAVAVSSQLATLVADELGRPFRPALVRRVTALPKTRSAKILRRAVRAAALGEGPGDLSGAENPGALDAIRDATRGS